MLRLISRLATITIFSFLCALIYTNLAIAEPGSTAMESLKGTGSTGSFSYEAVSYTHLTLPTILLV